MTKTKIDVIVPVLMPSNHLTKFRENIPELNPEIRINYVFDYVNYQFELPRINHDFNVFERVFEGKYGSPGLARNNALMYCDSKFVCFWDIDDLPDFEKALEFVSILESSGRDLGIGNWTFRDELETTQGVLPFEVGKSPGLWRFIFKREILEGLFFSELRWGEDQLYLLEIFSRKPSVLTTQDTLYRYSRNTPGSVTSKHSNALDLNEMIYRGIPLFSKLEKGFAHAGIIILLKQAFSIFKYAGFIEGFKSLGKVSPLIVGLATNPRKIIDIIMNGKKW